MLKNKFIAAFLMFYSLCPSAHINDLKGALRTIDANDTFTSALGFEKLGRTIIKIDGKFVSVDTVSDMRLYPWIKEEGQDASYFQDNPDYPPSPIYSGSLSKVFQLNDNRVAFYSHANDSLWEADTNSNTVSRFKIVDELFLAIKEQTGRDLSFYNKDIDWINQLSSGIYVVDFSNLPAEIGELWSYNTTTKEATPLFPDYGTNVVLTDGEKVIHRARISTGYNLYITDGTSAGTSLLYSYPRSDTSSSQDLHYSEQHVNRGIEPRFGVSYFFEYTDAVSGIHKLVEVKTSGEVITLMESQEFYSNLLEGIVSEDKFAFFSQNLKLFKYDYTKNERSEINLSGVQGSIARLHPYKMFGNNLLLGIQDGRFSTRFYTYNTETEEFSKVGGIDGDYLFSLNAVASDDNHLFLRAKSNVDSSKLMLLGYSVTSNKIDILNSNLEIGDSSFVQDGTLYSFTTNQNSGELIHGLYKFNLNTSSLDLAFISDKSRVTVGNDVNIIGSFEGAPFLRGIIANNGQVGSNSYVRALWTVKEGELKKIKQDSYFDDSIANYNGKVFLLETGNEHSTIYSYDYNSELLQEVYTDVGNQYSFRSIIGVASSNLLVETSHEAPIVYFDLQDNSLIEIEYAMNIANRKAFTCGDYLFASAPSYSDDAGLWRIENGQPRKVLNIYEPELDNSSSYMIYKQDLNIISTNCNTLQTNVLSTYSSFDQVTGKFGGYDTYYFQKRGDGAIYQADLSNNLVTRLGYGDFYDFPIHAWQITQQGIYTVAQNPESSLINQGIYKLSNGTFEEVYNLGANTLDEITSSYDDNKSWIVGTLALTKDKYYRELAIFTPETNELYNVDLFEGKHDSYPDNFTFSSGKLYFETSNQITTGGEFIEIKQDCLQEVLMSGPACDAPLRNQLPHFLNVTDRSYSPDSYAYISLRVIDADYDALSYRAEGLPDWIELSDNGVLKGYAPDENQEHLVRIFISDGEDEVATDFFKIKVTGAETQPPTSGDGNSNNEVSSSGGGGIQIFSLLMIVLACMRRPVGTSYIQEFK